MPKLGSRRSRLLLLGVGVLVAVLVLAIVIDSGVYYNKIHRGISISGRNVAGLTRDEATDVLIEAVDDAKDRPVTLKSGDDTWTVMPADLGLKIDIAGAVSSAMDVTRKSNFLVDLARRFKLHFAGTDVPLLGTVDTVKLDALMTEVSQTVDLPPVDAGLAIQAGGTITVVKAQSGWVVDEDALRDQLKRLLFSLHATELEIPMVVKEAEVQVQDEGMALEQAKVILGAPVTLTYGSEIWTLTPNQIEAYLVCTSALVNGVSTLVPRISPEKMGSFLNEIAASVDIKPVDATFKTDGEQAWVVPGVDGRVLDREKTAEALTAAALKTSRRTAAVVLRTVEPDRTTAEANAMGITERLDGYTTEYRDGTPERRTNVRMATKYASDVVVAPGEIYDFDKQVGPRTEERGFKPAKGITGPGKLEDVLGGGICQVSTTLFNAAFFAGLEIVERRNHSIFIDHYPTGRDATVTVGINMRFRNNTDHYILIRGASDGITTTFNIYGTDDGREVTYTTSDFYDIEELDVVTVTNTSIAWMAQIVAIDGQDGKACDVERTITWPDGTTKTNKFHSVWKMIPREIIVGYGPSWAPRDTTTTATTAQ